MTGGEGDRIQPTNSGGNGEGVLTWYKGERGIGDMSGMVGIPSGEGDLEWYLTLNEYQLVPNPWE